MNRSTRLGLLVALLVTASGCGDEVKKGGGATAGDARETDCSDGVDNDGDGHTDCDDLDCRMTSDACALAAPLDRTVATTVTEAARFLYTGPDPLQKGADAEKFDARRIAMVRGRVVDRAGEPLAGVKVSVAERSEYGYTQTRSDGFFDLAVNGGARLVLKYELDGYVPAQRVSQPGWQRYGRLPEVGLIEESDKTSALSSGHGSVQIAVGEETDDQFGVRQPLVLLQPQTRATAELPDGSEEDLSNLTLRITEYPFETSAPGTWQRTARFAPGTLPGSGALHYGLELRVDEAERLEARWVSFSKPVSLYIENFLNLPIGAPVPLGYYDRKLGQWQPAEGGRVIKILSTEGGTAVIDADGDGEAETEDVLDDLDITGAELNELATRYEPGTELWRAMVRHFSPWDVLFPVSAPPGSVAPSAAGVFSRSLESPARRGFAVVETQALAQSVPINGTPFSLTYQSDRTQAYQAAFEMELPLVPERVPPGLKAVFSTVRVAGKESFETFDPEPSLTQVVEWDGEDAFGRQLQGPQTAEITIGYVFDSIISIGRTFGASGMAEAVSAEEAGIDIPGSVLSQDFETTIGVWDAAGYELGGFSIDALHGYDAAHQRLFFGSGDVRDGQNVGLVVRDLARGDELGTPDSVAVAPDGSIIVSDDQENDEEGFGRILRIDPDGEVTVVAGPGAEGEAADAGLRQPQGVVVTADGSIIVADFLDDAVKKILPDGSLDVLVGPSSMDPVAVENLTGLDGLALGPSEELFIVDNDRVLRFEGGRVTLFAGGGMGGDGGPATDAELIVPSGVVAAPDGSVFISERGDVEGEKGHRVRKVLPDGTITTVAGTGVAGFSGDGLDARLAQIDNARGLTLGGDGSLYIADQFNDRIRRVTPDGIILTVVGGGEETDRTEGQVATQVRLDGPDGIALGKDGKLFVPNTDTMFLVAPGLPELSDRDNLIPSFDGHTLYRFDNRGKHQETIDVMTGLVELRFEYDDDGRLASLRDKDGLVTELERRSNGELSAIVAPFGQRTRVGLDDSGRITTSTDDLERVFQFGYAGDAGPLTSAIDPKGGEHVFEYDELGLLTKLTDPTGYSETLERGKADRGYEVTVTTPSGRDTHYAVRALPGEILEREVRLPDETSTKSSDALVSNVFFGPDGSLVMKAMAPDPFFGAQAPFASATMVTTPSGRTLTTSTLREKVLTDPENALTLEEWRESSLVNDLETTSVYNRAERTLTTTSPEGRSTTTTFDELGRKIAVEAPGLPTTRLRYDSRGRVVESTVEAGDGVRTTTFEYGDDGFLLASRNPVGDEVVYARDAIGRVTELVRPDSESIVRELDANDNLLSLTPPGRNAHAFQYRGVTNLLEATVPPRVRGVQGPTDLPLGESRYAYNDDLDLEALTRSDGRGIELEYDSSGRTKTIGLADADITFGYDANGVLTSVNRSDSVRVAMAVDGPLVIGTTWTGAIEGAITATYDENFRLSTMTVNGASSATFTHDDDGLVTSATANGQVLTLARDADTGFVGGTILGLVSTTHRYSGFGELSALIADFDDSNLFEQDIERDALGRVTSITELVEGETCALSYAYDDLGRLVEATRNGVTTSYAYDANGNRLALSEDGEEVFTGDYDAQDRVVSYADLAFEQTAQGELLRINDGESALELTYDELGNLMTAVLSDSSTSTDIEFVVDGFGRRIAKRVNGAFSRAWLYRDALRPVSEVDADGTFMHFIYAGGKTGAPDFILRAGVPLRVIKDHVGSVRLVVNAQTGAIEQRLDYDEFGRVLEDTRPGFQPFGFAGGLYDPDTRLVRFGKRDYSADIGRWVAKDPIGFDGGDTNLYAYCGNDPINRVDPDGQYAHLPIGAAIITFVGIMLATDDQQVVGAIGGGLAGPVLGAAGRLIGRGVGPILGRVFAQEAAAVGEAAAPALAKTGGGLAHLTNNVYGAAIAESGKITVRGGIYASTLTTAARTGLGYSLRTGLAGPTVGFRIPQGTLSAFSRPVPIGPLTAIQRWGGTHYTAGGTIDLAAGTFTRTGVAWSQVQNYAMDAAFDAFAVGGVVYAFGN